MFPYFFLLNRAALKKTKPLIRASSEKQKKNVSGDSSDPGDPGDSGDPGDRGDSRDLVVERPSLFFVSRRVADAMVSRDVLRCVLLRLSRRRRRGHSKQTLDDHERVSLVQGEADVRALSVLP